MSAQLEIHHLEDSYKYELYFINTLASGDTKDVNVLNVSGTNMAIKKSAVHIIEDSVLDQQFDNSKWIDQECNNSCVK